jgi:hypothetical protein
MLLSFAPSHCSPLPSSMLARACMAGLTAAPADDPLVYACYLAILLEVCTLCSNALLQQPHTCVYCESQHSRFQLTVESTLADSGRRDVEADWHVLVSDTP